jgi:hypothetical protein
MQDRLQAIERLRPEELDLVAELLECEEKKLSIEIRHTDTAEFRATLQRRQEMIGVILGKLKLPA